jgi:hypothetical protein
MFYWNVAAFYSPGCSLGRGKLEAIKTALDTMHCPRSFNMSRITLWMCVAVAFVARRYAL